MLDLPHKPPIAMRFSTLMLLTALSFLTCKSTEKNTPIQAPAGFDWQAHRGCRGIKPENTLPAFLHAMEYPEVVTLELDLAVSKDNQLIVSHEPWFNPAICRLPNGDSIPKKDGEKYLIYQYTAAQIRDFDCGSTLNARFPEQQTERAYKPTLSEVVQAVRARYPNRTIRWNIEIKSEPAYDGIKTPPIEQFVELVLTACAQLGIEQTACIQSFDVRPLQIIHQRKPDLTLAFLIENARGLDYNMDKLGFVPDIYSPYYLVVNKKLVRRCHQKNMKLIPWTVNDVTAMRKLVRLGVDGIITDYPNRIAAVAKP
jgi:glycerophosphoryl diester phosphodiesterase